MWYLRYCYYSKARIRGSYCICVIAIIAKLVYEARTQIGRTSFENMRLVYELGRTSFENTRLVYELSRTSFVRALKIRASYTTCCSYTSRIRGSYVHQCRCRLARHVRRRTDFSTGGSSIYVRRMQPIGSSEHHER